MSARRDWIRDVDDYTTSAKPSDVDGAVEADIDALEAALFDAAADGDVPELAFLDTLATIAPWFNARSGFSGGLTREQMAAVRAQPRVHYIEIAGSGVTEIPPWPDDTEIVAYRVGIDMRGYRDIVVTLTTLTGEHFWTFRDGQYDPTDGNLYAMCDEPLARTTFRHKHLVARVEAARDGKVRTVTSFELLPVG